MLMIKAIYIFNSSFELVIRKSYSKTHSPEEIAKIIKNNTDGNFIDLTDTLIHKLFDRIHICLITDQENEMFALSILTILTNILERMMADIHQDSIEYYFKDISFTIDNFIINGKIIGLDPLEICASANTLKTSE